MMSGLFKLMTKNILCRKIRYMKREISILKRNLFLKVRGLNISFSEQTFSLEKEFVKFDFDLHPWMPN